MSGSKIGVVVIGRNEGQRLIDCIASVEPMLASTVYVDSGSTDNSVDHVSGRVAVVVRLDMTVPFTAARARNAGAAELLRLRPDLELIQFVDGDCTIDPGWLDTAAEFVRTRPKLALVFGRRRERYPERSPYNTMCDAEWDTPIGQVLECGGDSLVRVAAFQSVGGFSPGLVAGEEPEFCVRLRERGWVIMRIDAEMTLHDANILHFRQWWLRNVRAGHAFAEVSRLHASSSFGIWRRQLQRSVLWTLLPITAVVGATTIHWTFLLLLLLIPLQIARLALRSPVGATRRWHGALFTVIGKFAEFQGVLRFYRHLLLRRHNTIIEYK